eukprot:177781_1
MNTNNTLYYSLPSLLNVCALLFCLMFIYSIIGIHLFANISYNNDGITPYSNFNSFGMAMLTLYRLITFDSWNIIYQSIIIAHENSLKYTIITCIYFLSFGII